MLSSRGKLGDVAAALAVTKGRAKRVNGEREKKPRRRAGGVLLDVAAIGNCNDDNEDECGVAAALPALLALARQAAASERIAAATTR